jgi:crotonobetainyl-CoA:carnitine CoA-transferase CaiB-like acyl-CoA transferase
VRLIGIPYRLSDTPAGVDRPPPVLGADTDDVLRELIGLDGDAVALLRRDGII